MKLGWLIFAIVTLVLSAWGAVDVIHEVSRIADAMEKNASNYEQECISKGYLITQEVVK